MPCGGSVSGSPFGRAEQDAMAPSRAQAGQVVLDQVPDELDRRRAPWSPRSPSRPAP